MRLRLPHKRAPRNQAGARRETLGRIGFRAVRKGVGVGPTYLHKRCHSCLFWMIGDGL